MAGPHRAATPTMPFSGPGMVVTLEPTICFSEGGDIFVSIEDQFLVTESGAEWLTRDAPLDLYV